MVVNHKKLNPVGFHLLKYLQDPTIRQVILYGGSSSGKSYSVAEVFLILAMVEGSDMLVMRKVGASIKDTIYKSFKSAAEHLGVTRYFKFIDGVKEIRCTLNKSCIVFKGLDDAEKIKGLESIKRVFMDEWSEFEEIDYKQMKLRLRGIKGQQLIFAFNPISETHWIKKNVFDCEKWHDVPMEVELGGKMLPPELTRVKSIRMNESKSLMDRRTGEIVEHPSDIVVIQSTYLNNFWVVGSPDGTYGYYDEQAIATFEYYREHDPDYYNVYCLGEWGIIRTGSEFFPSFNRGKHSQAVEYNPTLPIHISVDNNRLPYISYTFWQADYTDGLRLSQFHEICATSPNNSALKSAKVVAEYLRSIKYTDKVYLHGDASTRNGSTVDDDGRSFLDKVISTLIDEGFEVVDKVGKSNPSVSMTGEFINAVWDEQDNPGKQPPELSIIIGENCSVSIEDYMSVQKDANGAILKKKVMDKVTGQSYEKNGHLSDTLRYIVYDIMNEQYMTFANRRKYNLYARDGVIHFFNPETECKYDTEIVYCMPNVAGKLVMIHGKKCGEFWHIADVAFNETTSTSRIKERLDWIGCSPTLIECAPAYFQFVRDLREDAEYDIRVIPEAPDVDTRIAATSDFVRDAVQFDETKASADGEYSAFLSSLLDYNKDNNNKEASTALSGFVQWAAKLQSGT